PQFFYRQLNDLLPVRSPVHKPSDRSVLIEFVSANPTGPLHIGHGRGAALGDSLARILRFSGHRVSTEYYVNDIGNQILTLTASVQARMEQQSGTATDLPADGYHGAYIIDIARTVSEQMIPADRLPAYIVQYILDGIRRDLDAFNVRIDSWFHESKLHKENQIAATIEKLTHTEHIYEKDGALWLRSTAYGDEKDRVVRRSDGRYTYLASDIGYHANKLERKHSRLINIWGTDHHGYVKRLQAAMHALEASPERLVIILYQLVSLSREGKPVPMSTRSGSFVTLNDVIDEVGSDAARFFFSLRSPQSHLDFDLELAKKRSQENPVYYVQYVHARICSIFREAQRAQITTEAPVQWDLLNEPAESALIKKLASFHEIIMLCTRELSPHYLTHYLLDVAALFHRFYDTCRVIGPDRKLTNTRLQLIQAVQNTIAKGLELIGVSAPERM
ncbi:MAG: arginine--tRNA ligase, partial [Elusimicrobia bacterium]|nr:arginine--tRNA ligase [Elusimicrobiota bacterium]